MKCLHILSLMIAVLFPFAHAQTDQPAGNDKKDEKAVPAQADDENAPIKPKTGKHFFILSGQSNMHHMPAGEFKAVVAKEFGEENVSIAFSAKTGASIRFWDKEFPWPGDGAPQGRTKPGKKPITREEYVARFGELYDKLSASIQKNAAGRTFDSVTFVWMQGESDSNRDPEFYFQCFDRVVARLKSDLNIDSMNIVIGRLSDCGMSQDTWVKFREGQVKYAEAKPNRGWINTDDLNDKIGKDGNVVNDLHYTQEGYKILAQRFAEKAVELIKQGQKK